MTVRCIWRIACAITGLSLATSASARDYYFFNKPGVDRQAYLQDRVACEQLTGGGRFARPDITVANQQIWQNRNLTTGQAAVASGIASMLVGFMAARERRHLALQVERICLADKGYKRLEMDGEAYREIEKTKDRDLLIDRWFALASGLDSKAKEMPE